MKPTISWTAVVLSAACAPAAANSQARSTEMPEHLAVASDRSAQNATTLRELYERAFNARRLDLLPELVASDYVGPRGERGPEGFAQTIRGLTTGIPNLRFEIEDIAAGPSAAAVRWRWSGNHTGVLFGLAPSNRPVTNSGISFYHFDAVGKVVRSQVETDRLGLLQQLGLVDPSLGAPRPPR